jgi:hypothetical protein
MKLYYTVNNHKDHMPFTPARFFEAGLQSFVEKDLLLAQIGFGRNLSYFETFHAQAFEKLPHSGGTAPDAGPLFNPVDRLVDGPGQVGLKAASSVA